MARPGEVGELEEAAAGVGPAQRLGHGTAGPSGLVEAGEAGIRIGLEDSRIAGEVLPGVLAATVGRIVEQHRRLALAERPVVADIGPEPAGGGLAFRQHRHRRVVPVQTLGAEHVLADQLMQRCQDSRRGANEIGQGRQVEVDTLPGVTFALPVERLVAALLLEQDHGQQAGADPAARYHVEGGRRLADRLAVAAAALLAHHLLHEPLARDHVEGLGDRLADLRQPAPTAAGAGGRRRAAHWARITARAAARSAGRVGGSLLTVRDKHNPRSS